MYINREDYILVKVEVEYVTPSKVVPELQVDLLGDIIRNPVRVDIPIVDNKVDNCELVDLSKLEKGNIEFENDRLCRLYTAKGIKNYYEDEEVLPKDSVLASYVFYNNSKNYRYYLFTKDNYGKFCYLIKQEDGNQLYQWTY